MNEIIKENEKRIINENKESMKQESSLERSINRSIDYASLFPDTPIEKYIITLYDAQDSKKLDDVISYLANMYAEVNRYNNGSKSLQALICLKKFEKDLDLLNKNLKENAYELSGLFAIKRKNEQESEKESYIDVISFLEKVIDRLKTTIYEKINRYESQNFRKNPELAKLKYFLQKLKQENK